MLQKITILILNVFGSPKYSLLFLFINIYCIGLAQPKADFIASTTSGCSPLIVSFTNTTTGATSSVTYKWDFGNSNSSTNKDAATTYSVEQSYTVTLTATDNNGSSSKSMIITVVKNPTPSFTVNTSSGCTPFKVVFTSTSSLGSGNVGYYYWDFGDGNTVSGDSLSQIISHEFITPGLFTIKLQVKTNSGCATTLLSKPNLISVQSRPVAAYTRSKSYLCTVGESDSFKIKSTAGSGSSYLWKFGDGTSATDISPITHVYSKKGVFSDSLIVSNSNGCSDTSFSPTPIYVDSSRADFRVPSSGLCVGSNVKFLNTSIPIPDVANWYISGPSTALIGIDLSNVFFSAGNYNLKLVNHYGTCSDSILKTITIVPGFSLAGFSVSSASSCGGKTMVTLIDTSHSKSSFWNLQSTLDTLTTDTAHYQFSQDSTYNISLTSTNSLGCIASVVKPVAITHIPMSITSTSNNPLSNNSGCPGLQVRFSANPSSNIKTYSWNFGDSIRTSSDSSPIHTYDSLDAFAVKLNYTTFDGCSDSTFFRNVIIFSKPAPSFTVLNQDNCGGGIQFFDQTPMPVDNWNWYFGDSTTSIRSQDNITSTVQNPKHFFYDTGYYNIKLVAANRTCSDSITYPQYVHIKAPIAHIDSVTFTCAGDRSTVVFWSYYKYVVSGTWDFGDNSPLVLVDTTQHFISHHYPKTGTYLAILTTTNGSCTPKDTLGIPILTNQRPLLKANVTSVCANDTLNVFLDTTSLSRNPSSLNDSNYYSIYAWQYGDASVFNQGLIQQPNWYYSYLGTLTGLIPGKTNLRVITQSENFGCLDTSNFINLIVKGPVSGFSITNPKDCFKHPLSFIDTSKINFGVPIVKWEWNFGDKTFDTLTTNGNTTHTYNSPNPYVTALKVIDKDGCYNISQQTDSALPSGPKANFRWTPNFIITGTTANFINTTNAFGDQQISYLWTFFSDGKQATTINSTHAYNTSMTDSVQLIATNPENGCKDTVSYLISIKKVFAVFSIKTKYPNNSTCPPMQATFTSHSINADTLRWDFGDGVSTGLVSESAIQGHFYNEPGVYNVTLYAYKNGLLLDSSFKTITVKGAYATVTSNLTQGCIHSIVSLKSTQVNTASFTWDFGDGTVIVNSPDSFITHEYVTANIYTPHILLTDINGCKSSFPAIKSIVIDSLHTSFLINKVPVCDTGTVLFTPKIISFSADSLQKQLTYHWVFGTGNPNDTSNGLSPSFKYNTIGSYPVTQIVSSIYGCSATFIDTVFVKPSSRGIITGPSRVCEGDSVTFSAIPSIQGDVKWHWKFNNGDISSLQNPLAEVFKTVKDSVSYDTIQLVTMLNNCYDTTLLRLTVNPYPRVNLIPKSKQICEGDIVRLSASDGKQFFWNPVAIPISESSPLVSPSKNTTYYVQVSNSYGCTSIDSSTINVVADVKRTLIFPRDTVVCKGLSLKLPVSGADNYIWLKDSATLTNYGNNSTSPIATPVLPTTVYQFIAWNGSCAHDSEYITVIQVPFPTLSLKDTMTLLTGYSASLNPIVSNDVINYHWTPSDYLSDPSSSNPVCSPKKDIVYTLNVTNENGCTVHDSISIHLVCSESLFAPSAFIPSSNYLNNNVFFPKGQGIKEVVYLRVYNRGGELLFENNHFQPNEVNSGWDGNFNGKKSPSGTYVYTMQAQCDTGEFFERKGTIVLIR